MRRDIVARLDVTYNNGLDARFDLYYPEDATEPPRTIIRIHGGGFVTGSKDVQPAEATDHRLC